MPEVDSLRRLGGGRWETRDGRFAIEPQSGTWVVVDNEQTDELGLPLVRGPFGSLTSAREAIEAARSEGPAPSPLAERIEQARQAEAREPKAARPSKLEPEAPPGPAPPREPPKPAPAPEPPPEPRWLRDLEPTAHRRARDLIARLKKLGIADPERVARAEIAEGQPALARLAIERGIGKALASAKDSPDAVRGAVNAILRGADVGLGVSWLLVDDQGRRIERLEIRDQGDATDATDAT
jgi:hypothetical protein